jgi:hypothetical protein
VFEGKEKGRSRARRRSFIGEEGERAATGKVMPSMAREGGGAPTALIAFKGAACLEKRQGRLMRGDGGVL